MSLILDGTSGVSDIDGTAATPAIRGTDTNTGIFFPAADTIAFSEGGVESMRIDSSGNVGIGTASPTKKLFIADSTFGAVGIYRDLDVTSVGAAAQFIELGARNGATFTPGAAVVGALENPATTGFLRFDTRSSNTLTERMRIDSSGNLLVGTTSAAVADSGADNLVVGPGTGSNGITIYSANSGNANLNFADTDSVFPGFIQYQHAGNNMNFRTNGSEAMRINSAGNVGIGTSNPTNLLQVASTTSDPYILVGGTAARDCGIKFNATTEFTALRADGGNRLFVNAGSEMRFLIADSERMRITSGGVVLVGTTSAPLYGKFQAYASADNNASFVADGGFNPILVWNKGTSNQPFIEFGSGASYVARGSITTNGTGTTYGTASDYRLKENIAPMTGALGVVQQLKPVTYNWKVDGSSGQGFIAHELQAVVPDCVTGEKDAVDKDGNIKPQGVDTSFLVATLTCAIQEQQALIQNLTTRLNALEGK